MILLLHVHCNDCCDAVLSISHTFTVKKVIVKVKFTLEQAMKSPVGE